MIFVAMDNLNFMFLYHLMFVHCFPKKFPSGLCDDFYLFLFLSTLDDILHHFSLLKKKVLKHMIKSNGVKGRCCAATLWTVWNSSSWCALIHISTIKSLMSKDWLCILQHNVWFKIIKFGVFTSGSAVLWSSLCLTADSWRAHEQGSEPQSLLTEEGWGGSEQL